MTAAFSQGCTKESRLPAEISSEAVQRYSLLLNNCKHTISDACCTFFKRLLAKNTAGDCLISCGEFDWQQGLNNNPGFLYPVHFFYQASHGTIY